MTRAKGLTRVLVGGLLAIGVTAASAAPSAASAVRTGGHLDTGRLVRDLRADLAAHLQTNADLEHASAAILSVSLPGRRSTIDVSAGTTRLGGSKPVRTGSLRQIASNTKAFTAVLLLKLEAEHRLSIASYNEQPAMLADFAANPYKNFSSSRLVGWAPNRAGSSRTSGPGRHPPSGRTWSSTGRTDAVVRDVDPGPGGVAVRPQCVADDRRHHRGCLGVYASVRSPGVVRVGDPVRLR